MIDSFDEIQDHPAECSMDDDDDEMCWGCSCFMERYVKEEKENVYC